jgi:hypothetical protein
VRARTLKGNKKWGKIGVGKYEKGEEWEEREG